MSQFWEISGNKFYIEPFHVSFVGSMTTDAQFLQLAGEHASSKALIAEIIIGAD